MKYKGRGWENGAADDGIARDAKEMQAACGDVLFFVHVGWHEGPSRQARRLRRQQTASLPVASALQNKEFARALELSGPSAPGYARQCAVVDNARRGVFGEGRSKGCAGGIS